MAAGEGVDADTPRGVPVDVDRWHRHQPCITYWDPKRACAVDDPTRPTAPPPSPRAFLAYNQVWSSSYHADAKRDTDNRSFTQTFLLS